MEPEDIALADRTRLKSDLRGLKDSVVSSSPLSFQYGEGPVLVMPACAISRRIERIAEEDIMADCDGSRLPRALNSQAHLASSLWGGNG